jgi:cell division protein FtsZ
MTLNLSTLGQMHTDFTPRITVIGVGGAGSNAVDNMIAAKLCGVEFVAANTDVQQLMRSRADRRVQLGPRLTQGLGAGAKPDIGRAAAEEVADELYRHLDSTHMVFITAGMGGGTGTGAAPVIARMARERGILTVGVVTQPFVFEGARRARIADEGISDLQQYIDTLIVVPNQHLFHIANERTTWNEALKMADQVLYMSVRSVTDLMMVHGQINLDFNDIKTVMADMGKALLGKGEADGDDRATHAAEAAINNPLLEDASMAGARGLLINITGGNDLCLYEVDEAVAAVRRQVHEDANVLFGTATDETLEGRIRVSFVATGIEGQQLQGQPLPRPVAVQGGTFFEPGRNPTPAMGKAQAPMPEPMEHDIPGVTSLRRHATQPERITGPDASRCPDSKILERLHWPVTPDALDGGSTEIGGLAHAEPIEPPVTAQNHETINFAPQSKQQPSRLFTHAPTFESASASRSLGEPLARSLFKSATALFRKRAPSVPARAAVLGSDALAHHGTMAVDEDDLDIPAFVRRQSFSQQEEKESSNFDEKPVTQIHSCHDSALARGQIGAMEIPAFLRRQFSSLQPDNLPSSSDRKPVTQSGLCQGSDLARGRSEPIPRPAAANLMRCS